LRQKCAVTLAGLGRRHGRMTELEKFQRATRVFLARLLIVHGEDAPDLLRRMADELEWLA